MVTAVLPEAAAGADDALELLYRDHAQDVSRYALAVLGDRSDAEDVTQTTFLNAYRALQRGERPRQPDHWLIAIAHNACRERFRNGQRRPREVAFVDEVSAAAVRDDDGPTADELRSALLQLPASQRAALVMRELEGRPIRRGRGRAADLRLGGRDAALPGATGASRAARGAASLP